eukprot:768345-Hanusia_phi.AAC.2
MIYAGCRCSDTSAKNQAAAHWDSGATAKSEQGIFFKLNSFETPKAAADEEPESQIVAVRVRELSGSWPIYPGGVRDGGAAFPTTV